MVRRIILAIAVLALCFAWAGVSGGKNAVGKPIRGEVAIDYNLIGGGIWSHVYTIDKLNPETGEFSGTGHLAPDASYTEIITGKLLGNEISFHILYTGANAGYIVDAVGTMGDDGQLRGTATSPGQEFTWTGSRAQEAPKAAAREYEPVERQAGGWVVAGDYDVDYDLVGGGVWKHRYTIDTMNLATGEFSGTGHIISDASYTEIITGKITGDHLSFHILYTGTNAGYTVDAVATIGADGRLGGGATGPDQVFTWTSAGKAVRDADRP